MDIFALKCRLEEMEGIFKGAAKSQNVRGCMSTFIVITLCSGQPRTHHYLTVLIVIKSRHALCRHFICFPLQPAAVLATQTCCDSHSVSSTSCLLLLFSQWPPTKGARGSVIYKDYQRNMMSKGKLQLCARPTGRQGWEAAQTEWMYLLFM